jgi:hypothetical protein
MQHTNKTKYKTVQYFAICILFVYKFVEIAVIFVYFFWKNVRVQIKMCYQVIVENN